MRVCSLYLTYLHRVVNCFHTMTDTPRTEAFLESMVHASHVVSASLEKPFSTEGGQGVVCPDARFYFGCRALDATRELQSWHRATADRRRPGGTTPGTMTLPTTPLQGSLEKWG